MSTTSKSYTFKVEAFRRLPDPAHEGRERYYAICNVENLPRNLPTETNPREQNTHTKVAKRIQAGLMGEHGDIFHLLNRGLLLSAAEATFNNRDNTLTVHMPNAEKHGLVDGGHTYKIILDSLGTLPLKQYVSLEIMTGIEDDFTNIAGARNTSVQVQDKALLNLEGSLDVVKRLVEKEPFASDVAYKQFEDKEIDVLDVIAVMALFNVDAIGENDHPIFCYSSKARALSVFSESRGTYGKFDLIVHDIFVLHEHVRRTFWDMYRKGGGRLGGRKEIGYKDSPYYPLKYLGRSQKGEFQKICYDIPQGFVLPILGAMRAIVSNQEDPLHFTWRWDPISFYDSFVGEALVQTTMEASFDHGQNPNAVGKSRRHWDMLYRIVESECLKQTQ